MVTKVIYALWTLVLACAVWIGYMLVQAQEHPIVCVKQAKVVEITAVNYRTATVRLEDGSLKDLMQPTVSPGSPVCIEFERKQ